MKINIISLIVGILIMSSCSNKNSENIIQSDKSAEAQFSISENSEYSGQESQTVAENNTNTANIQAKIIKTAKITMEVEDLKKSRLALNNLLNKYNAYISDEKVSEWDTRLNDEITLRVAAENFDSLLNQLGSLSLHIVSKHIKQSDVTEEYIDVKTRLENKKKVEQQYLELLKKAKTINEILQVSEHLRKIREEIEAKEGRLKFLDSQISLSTIYLTMYQYRTDSNYPEFGNKLSKAFKGGWEGIQLFIIGLIYLWPFIILISVTLWLIIRNRKKKAK